MRHTIRIGTAGWSIPRQCADAFAGEGTHLERYATIFPATEINTSFYRPHKPATYARWAASVPPDFRFAVKLPREITHRRKLVGFDEPLERFLAEIAQLGDRLGPVLVQLAPSLAYDEGIAQVFFQTLRARFSGQLVFEPRHPSWFTSEVERTLSALRIARVAADSALVPGGGEPGGWPGIAYWRLHGSPRVYYSVYTADFLSTVARKLRQTAQRGAQVWCILDNTASGAACGDALSLLRRIERGASGRRAGPAPRSKAMSRA